MMALSPLDLFLMTFRELKGNWVRSGLTALGIFMGVAAVSASLNISAISNAQFHPAASPYLKFRASTQKTSQR